MKQQMGFGIAARTRSKTARQRLMQRPCVTRTSMTPFRAGTRDPSRCSVTEKAASPNPIQVNSSDSDSCCSHSSSSSSISVRRTKRPSVSLKKINKRRPGSDDEDSSRSQRIDDLDSEEEVDGEIELEGQIEIDVQDEKLAAVDDGYVGDWSGGPEVGSEGFNSFATSVMQKAGVPDNAIHASQKAGVPDNAIHAPSDSTCPCLQPHQQIVTFLVHPKSPISRLLVDHPTGSGKTRAMLGVLDNFFHDTRPKIPVFPTEPVCRSFYAELLRWPNKYRDYFACLCPEEAAKACEAPDWRSRRSRVWSILERPEVEIRQLCQSVRDTLEMKGCFFMGKMRRSALRDFHKRFPGELMPAAPLRALRYTSAGGRHAELGQDSLPASALFKIRFDGSNVYSNKVVLLDEVHNLVREETQYGEQLHRLRDLLFRAQGLVLVGFTGTPILNEPSDSAKLLDIIRGYYATSRKVGSEGFLSSFPMRPAWLFPQVLPHGIPDAVMSRERCKQLVQKIQLKGDSLKMYDAKKAMGFSRQRLSAYCNMSVHFGRFHESRNGSKLRVLESMDHCAPKLHAIACAVAASSEKAVIFIARNSGYDAMLSHMRTIASSSSTPFNVASIDQLAEFNSSTNLRGERFRVLVVDSVQCSEGVSFFAVRRVFLADVPSTSTQFVQQCGRAVRMNSHHMLPVEERVVNVSMFVTTLPPWMRTPLGAWCFRAQNRECSGQKIAVRGRRLLHTLRLAGITDLETLKRRLTAYGEGKPHLETADALRFLKSVGLWREAKSLLELEKRQEPHACTNSALNQRENCYPEDSARVTGSRPKGKSRMRNKLFLALQRLYSVSDVRAVVDTLSCNKTSDEETLRMLVLNSLEIGSALAKLRETAVDHGVLTHLVKSEGGTTKSDVDVSLDELEESDVEDSEMDVEESEDEHYHSDSYNKKVGYENGEPQVLPGHPRRRDTRAKKPVVGEKPLMNKSALNSLLHAVALAKAEREEGTERLNISDRSASALSSPVDSTIAAANVDWEASDECLDTLCMPQSLFIFNKSLAGVQTTGKSEEESDNENLSTPSKPERPQHHDTQLGLFKDDVSGFFANHAMSNLSQGKRTSKIETPSLSKRLREL